MQVRPSAFVLSRDAGEEGARENEGFPELVRDATDSLVDLVAAHFKLANLELAADLQDRALELVVGALLVFVGLVGYALLMTGIALAARPMMSLWLAFILLGAFHVALAGITAIVIGSRRKRASRLEQAVHSVGTSVTRVADAILGTAPNVHVHN